MQGRELSRRVYAEPDIHCSTASPLVKGINLGMKILFSFLLCITLISSVVPATQRRKSSDFFPILSKGKWGFVDKYGTVIIEPQFEGAWHATEGLARVRINGKHGYVDASGKLIIPAQFEDANEFSEGLAPNGTTIGKYGYIDKSGEVCNCRTV